MSQRTPTKNTQPEDFMAGKFKDLSGQLYGRLYVSFPAGVTRKTMCFYCVCTCGTLKVIRGTSLRGGRTNSCGCLSREVSRQVGLELVQRGLGLFSGRDFSGGVRKTNEKHRREGTGFHDPRVGQWAVHIRWDINRGIHNLKCPICISGVNSFEEVLKQ
jgi:hypothetical protein